MVALSFGCNIVPTFWVLILWKHWLILFYHPSKHSKAALILLLFLLNWNLPNFPIFTLWWTMFWRFDRALPMIAISVRPCLLRTSRHHRLHLSCGSPLKKNLSLWCWDLRSCHLNCQSLWMCLICRGGLPSTGGWDTNTKSHASTRSKLDTHRGHHINVCMTHPWIIRVEARAQSNTGGKWEMSRQDEPSRRELASRRVNQN